MYPALGKYYCVGREWESHIIPDVVIDLLLDRKGVSGQVDPGEFHNFKETRVILRCLVDVKFSSLGNFSVTVCQRRCCHVNFPGSPGAAPKRENPSPDLESLYSQ